MVVLNRIYTRTGDAGETALDTGERVGSLRLDGTAREVADVVVLPSTNAMLLS